MTVATRHDHVDSPARFGARLRGVRQALGLSQRELSFPGCTAVYICRIERGDRVPSLQIIRKLAARLEVDTEWLATGKTLRNGGGDSEAEPDCLMDGTEDQDRDRDRWRIYRLCECETCEGSGKVWEGVTDADDPGRPIMRADRCPSCRGEGKVRQCIATASDEQGVGTALGRLALEGEFLDCPPGLLDTKGKVGEKWLIRPWNASPRNVSDAARVLGSARKGER